MSHRNFMELLRAKWSEDKFVCVGLDTEFKKLPAHIRLSNGGSIAQGIVDFNVAIIEATKDIACADKLNYAFYEKHGAEGFAALKATLEYAREYAPDVPIILDRKAGDIGNTNNGTAKMAFEHFQVDAITVNPYFGFEALQPFLDYHDKGIIALCRTSNAGANRFQNMLVDDIPLYQHVARDFAENWNQHGNGCLVFGATAPEELAAGRQIVGDMPLLIPGIGAQGGDVEKTVIAGMDSKKEGMIINSSRGIIYASQEADFADASRRATYKLNDQINHYR